MGSDVSTLRSKNYNAVDIAKFIAAFLVMTVHCSPFASYNSEFNLFIISTFSRFAVPFFFACSGFFFFKKLKWQDGKIVNCKENRSVLFKYIKRVTALYVLWSAIYLIWDVFEWYKSGWLSLHAFIDFGIAFVKIGSYYHLWYVISLIYATIFGYLLLSFLNKKAVAVLSVVLYLIGILTYSYNWINILPINILNSMANHLDVFWTSVFRAFPLIFIGYIAGTYKPKRKVKVDAFLFAISLVFLLVEYFLLHSFTDNNEKYSYILFTIPCEFYLFRILINTNANIKASTGKMLRGMSTFIYCDHPLILGVMGLVYSIDSFNSSLNYLILAVISAGVSYCAVSLSHKKGCRFLAYLY